MSKNMDIDEAINKVANTVLETGDDIKMSMFTTLHILKELGFKKISYGGDNVRRQNKP